MSLLTSKGPPISDTPYSKAISCIFDNLLPTRVHGIIELTRLVEAKDPETISKKHYVFCLFQDYLKDRDSYVYLSAINGIAALGTHCSEDVLHVLCKEFLDISSEKTDADTEKNQHKISEIRMKIGDTIVKITKKLGEMAVIHKTTLLNTMLCGCRDNDPFIRTSAISNLAEIAFILNYRLGSVIYEVLLCIWNIIENDKAIECRRAAVMVIGSLLKGLGKETLVQLKENLLPIYRILKSLYQDSNEDPILKLHAQIALEELNDIVDDFLFPKLEIRRNIIISEMKQNIVFK
ncbi:Transport and Golgi organization protein 6 homolog [Eumeta japonica]|uniref:Transport and Golgi organization protein 6 homolog n=1 Tax=Eumeta variegata TaxID=151549 RepID=A0A4C1ZJT2_EUMVA|nr:Transport and Golgi organization protein 6 homolog [Eumeta japonica]